MIDFRYHIVSIVAIFLALAVGIVLGSGPLEDDIGGFLEERTNQLADQKVELQTEIGLLRSQVDAAGTYAELVQPSVVRDLLNDTAVALIVLPGAENQSVDAISEAVGDAGGTVTERVTVTDAWAEDQQQAVLERLTDGLARDGWPADESPTAGDVLGAALLTDNDRLAGQPYAPATGVLAAFADAGFVEVDDEAISRAGAVIVVGSDEPDEATSLIWQDLIQALADTGATEVVVGPTLSAAAGGVVAQVRESNLADAISTVDWIETVPGVTTCVLALTDQIRGVVGHYGTGPGASGPAPSPIPVN